MKLMLLPGLPASDDNVIHLHHGEPTPWREGVVARCETDGGGCWIANAQPGNGYADEVVYWQRANAYIWIAKGATYLVRIDQGYSWKFIADYGITCKVSDDQKNAVIATYTDAICLDSGGSLAWQRVIAVDGVEISEIGESTVDCRACHDPPDGWHDCKLDRKNGQEL